MTTTFEGSWMVNNLPPKKSPNEGAAFGVRNFPPKFNKITLKTTLIRWFDLVVYLFAH